MSAPILSVTLVREPGKYDRGPDLATLLVRAESYIKIGNTAKIWDEEINGQWVHRLEVYEP